MIQTPTQYGCATHKDRGQSVCTNALKVKRSTIETVLLAGVKRELLSDEAFRAFEAEARALLKAEQPDPAHARRKLAHAQKELDNLLAAIKAGIITATTRAALEQAERQAEEAREELKAIERYEPTQMLPRAKEIYRELVASLETIEDVTAAREALRQIVGEVKLIPEGGTLTAEMQSPGLAGALQITVVAGARSERYSRPPLRFQGLK